MLSPASPGAPTGFLAAGGVVDCCRVPTLVIRAMCKDPVHAQALLAR
jgi:hypothetical protein